MLFQQKTKRPQLDKWLTKQYTEQEIKSAIMQLKHKAHGSDGIPGEFYKVLKEWISEPLTEILQNTTRRRHTARMEKWYNGTHI